jgi:hypothetical protein
VDINWGGSFIQPTTYIKVGGTKFLGYMDDGKHTGSDTFQVSGKSTPQLPGFAFCHSLATTLRKLFNPSVPWFSHLQSRSY